MKLNFGIAAGLSALAALASCAEDSGGATSIIAPGTAEQACLRAVINETGNGTAQVGSSSFSQAGTEVIVTVGEQKAPWKCIAYANGTTSRPQSLTDEGAL